jgi:hypothetical protein
MTSAVRFVLHTTTNIVQFRPFWTNLITTIYESQDGLIPQNALKWAPVAKGEIGGIHYDLTCSKFGRRHAQIISAQALTIINVADNLIDVQASTPQARERIVGSILHMINTGSKYESQNYSVNVLFPLCRDLHRRISSAPYSHRFFEEFEKLADAAIEQIRGNSSPEISRRIGAQTMALSAIIPYCFNSSLSSRYLFVAKQLGAYFNIIDDIKDVKEDTKQGIVTPMTAALDKNSLGMSLSASAEASFHEALQELEPHERVVCQTFKMMFSFYWRTEWIRKHIPGNLRHN